MYGRHILIYLCLTFAPLVVAAQSGTSENSGGAVRAGTTLASRAWEVKVEGSILNDPQLLILADEALEDLYNMRFSAADSVFDLVAGLYPRHPIVPFLKSLTLWWKILPTLSVNDTSGDEAFLREMARVIEFSEAVEDDPRYAFDAKFFKTAAHGFRGRLLSDRKEWLAAAQDGKQALDHIFELAAADTANADLLFGIGAYDYFAQAVPEKYPIVSPLMFFFPDGDKERGLWRLERAATDGRFVAAEAAYFLTQIHTVFEPNFRLALEWSSLLVSRYPGNVLFRVLLGRIQFRWGQTRAAEITFQRVASGYERGESGHVKPLVSQAHYYLGRNALRLDSVDVALTHFETALDLESEYSHDSLFRVMATLYKGITLEASGREPEARHAFGRVLSMREYASSHQRAREQLNLMTEGND